MNNAKCCHTVNPWEYKPGLEYRLGLVQGHNVGLKSAGYKFRRG